MERLLHKCCNVNDDRRMDLICSFLERPGVESDNSSRCTDVLVSTLERTKNVKQLQQQRQQQQRKPLSVAFNADGELIVHSIVPEGIQVATGAYGRCTVATKAFKAGSVVYQGYAALIDTSTKNDRFYLYLYEHAGEKQVEEGSRTRVRDSSSPIQVFRLDGLNSVKDLWEPNKSIRQVYGFDGFMNHSCNANVYCPLVYRSKNEMCYDTIALRDINAGDELTCDYACFDYECDGHVISQCGCKAINCRGEMKGFKGLSLAEKIRIMPMCDSEIVHLFFRENPDMILLESTIPYPNIRLIVAPEEAYIVAARPFAPGDLIFSNQATIISLTNFLQQTFVLKLVEENDSENPTPVKKIYFILLDKDRHFIHRPSYVESVGFDSFMDHSCNPNSQQHYENATTYSVYARRTICPGDKITCDYLKLDNEAEKQQNVAKICFLCSCGEENCRAQIYA
ncbi:hypothetical protein ACA910_020330 [Epithemia clementina (nom. ined.)]